MILVTGATGLLGSELVKQLYERGERVRALKRAGSTIPGFLKEYRAIEWVDADVLNQASLEDAMEGISKVYHCAAMVSFRPREKDFMHSTNYEGTANIVNLCLLHDIRLVHVSSVAALGEAKEDGIITEKNFWEFDGKQSPYSISKYESEMEVWRGIAEGLDAVIVNPSVIISKNPTPRSSGQLIEFLRKGPVFYTSGGLGVVDAEDVCKAMILLMESDISGERFILNAENLSYKALMDEAARCLNTSGPSLRLRKWMLLLASDVLKFLSTFGLKLPAYSKRATASLFKRPVYSSKKFLNSFPAFTFKPLKLSVKDACEALTEKGRLEKTETRI